MAYIADGVYFCKQCTFIICIENWPFSSLADNGFENYSGPIEECAKCGKVKK